MWMEDLNQRPKSLNSTVFTKQGQNTAKTLMKNISSTKGLTRNRFPTMNTDVTTEDTDDKLMKDFLHDETNEEITHNPTAVVKGLLWMWYKRDDFKDEFFRIFNDIPQRNDEVEKKANYSRHYLLDAPEYLLTHTIIPIMKLFNNKEKIKVMMDLVANLFSFHQDREKDEIKSTFFVPLAKEFPIEQRKSIILKLTSKFISKQEAKQDKEFYKSLQD